MKRIDFELPMMYGDHHVLAVRQLLLAQPGVKDVYASSSFRLVEITYDDTQTSPAYLHSIMAEAGYLDEPTIPTEVGSSPAHENGKPFFRHTAVFPQTHQSITFTQDTPDVSHPIWPCPGLKK